MKLTGIGPASGGKKSRRVLDDARTMNDRPVMEALDLYREEDRGSSA